MEYSYVNPEWKERQQPQKKKKKQLTVGVAVLLSCVMVATVIGLFAGVLLTNKFLSDRNAAQPAQIAQATEAPAAAVELPKTTIAPAVSGSAPAVSESSASAGSVSTRFAYDGQYTRAQICEIAAPSVVGIDIVQTVTYWGQSYAATGSGSGVILTSDGYIATCAHVVDGANEIRVTTNDDTVYTATLIGSDSRNDIAIIKIEAENLIPAEIGDSDMLTVGEDVIAIGNPLGELRGSATSGIISAMNRAVTIEGTPMELLQTDAAISPGNSGGGLFNASGKLIGIVNAKASASNSEGLAFAIPVNNVLKEINDLLNFGYIKGRASLGVRTQNVTLRGEYYGFWSYSSTNCVQVTSVIEGGAAEAVGIREGDLIISVNGTSVTSNSVLSDLVSGYNAGETATVTIQRDGKQQDITVTFGEYVPAA